jgi:hypothetical protein
MTNYPRSRGPSGMTIFKKGNVIPIALVTLVLPVVGIISVAFVTSPGVGISPDSTVHKMAL